MRNNIYLTFSTSVVLSASLLVSGVTPGWSEDLHQVDVDGCTYNLSLGKQPINDWIDAYGGEDGLSKWPYWGNQPLASAIALNEGVPYKEGVSTFLPWNDSYISGGKTYTPSYRIPEGEEAKVQHTTTQRWLVAFDSQSCDSGPVNIEKNHTLSSVPEKTAPVFDGGTLEVDQVGESNQDFRVNNVEGNTIDSKGNYVRFTGEFDGQGGLTFQGSPHESQKGDPSEIQLAGNVDYTGETVVATSGGVALAIQDKQATPKGDITIQDGGILRLRGDGIEVDRDLVIEDGGTLGIFGKDVILKGDVELSDDLNKQLGSSFYVDLSHARAEDQLSRPEIIGNISGAGSFVKKGPGSLALGGVNTYEGKTHIKNGVLEITNVNGLGSADAGTRVEKDAVLRISVDGERTPQGSTSNDAQINEEITLAGGVLDLNGNYLDLRRGVVLEGEGINSTIKVKDGSTEVFARSVISGDGGLIKDGEGFLRLGGVNPQSYGGETIINAGELRFAENTSTPSTTDVTVNQGATLRLMGGRETDGGLNTVRSITGEGRIVLNTDKAHLSVDVPSGENPNFKGSILGGPNADSLQGTFIKDGDGKQILSGKNAYGSLIVEGGQLDINGENIDTEGMKPFQASVSLRLGHGLFVNGGTALRVTGHDLDPTYGPRKPGEEASSEGSIAKIADHTLPIIEFDDSENELKVENGSLLVASFIDALPTDYDAYKDNCKEGSDEKTCYSIRPRIVFGNGADSMVNNGLVVGPGDAGTGNHLQLRFQAGNDTLTNGLNKGQDRRSGSWLGCVTAGADDKGFNGYKYGNTCDLANEKTGGNLPDANSKDVKRNYTVNAFMGPGNDKFTNHQGSYLRGSFYGEGGDDELGNQGVIHGNIVMGKGSDTVTFQGGGAKNDGQSRGIGVLDDRLILGSSRDIAQDQSDPNDLNRVNLFGNALISYRNSVGWGIENGSDLCGGKKSTTGRSDYGCRWDDGGYNYSAIIGSNGKDNIWIKKKSDGTQPVQIWGSVELGASNDALRLNNFEQQGADLRIVGDLDLGTGDSQIIEVGETANFSVRAIHGDNVRFTISDSATATLGGDPELGVFEADNDIELSKKRTLSSYTGTTTIQEGGTLRAGQAWSLSSKSIHQVDGTLVLGDNPERNREGQAIGELTGEGLVRLLNGSHLFYGGLDGNVEFSGTSEGNGGLVKEGSGTTTFSGTFGHTGSTKVQAGTLLIGPGGKLNKVSTVFLGGAEGTLDLGGTTQSVDKIVLRNGKAGTLKNGSLDTGTVEVQGNGFIDDVGSNGGSASLVVDGLNDGGYTTLTGDNQFKDLTLKEGKVLLGSFRERASGAHSLVLDGGVIGSAYRDALVLNGALTLGDGKSVELAGGDDLFLIGNQGSLKGDLDTVTIDGGEDDLDIFWDGSGNYYSLNQDADGVFTEAEDSPLAGQVKNFEIVGVAGQGIAYFGELPSFVSVQAEGSPPAADYGLMLGSVGEKINGVDQQLTINSAYASGDSDELITIVGGIALGKGDAKIVVPGGTLEAGVIYGEGDSTKNSIELGSSFTGTVERGALASVAKGRFDADVVHGYSTINQLGGLWEYNGYMPDTDLVAQGVVRVQADDRQTFKSITARQRAQEIATPFGIKGRAIIAVSGELTVGEGGIQEQDSTRASLLVGSKDSGEAHVDLNGESLYSGPTIVARGGSLRAHVDNALSPVSKTLVGKLGTIEIEGSQAVNRLLVRKDGQFIGGSNSKLTTKSIVNRGDIDLDSLVIEDGMTRFIDRYIQFKDRRGESVPVDSPLRKIDAQGSLKNLGGSISVAGDLKFESTGNAGGHALLNLSTGDQGLLSESEATLSANSIAFSDKNDALINTGFIQVTGADGINFGGGNDLVLSKGSFDMQGGKIDGGELLDATNWQSGNRQITGLNIFKAYEDPGVQESDLTNWAAIKLGSDQDWIFPQGGDCRVTGDRRTFSKDTFCVGLTGTRQDQSIVIAGTGESQPTVDAGVIALGRGSSNTIQVQNGNLHAILIEGAPGKTKQSTNDRLLLGDDEGGSGELIVGAITGFDSMQQRGGTWSYAVNGVDDPQVRDRLIESGRRTEEELDEMGSFPALTGYGTVNIAPVEITGRNRKQKTVQRAAFARIEGDDSDNPLHVHNIDSQLDVAEGIHGNASLTTSGNTLLNGESGYWGATTIQSGGELKAGNDFAFSGSSDVTIEPGGVLDLDGHINSVSGLFAERSDSDPGTVRLGSNCSDVGECDRDLSGGILYVSHGDFSGTIEDVPGSSGALVKAGNPDDVLTLGGPNQYFATTLIEGGVLKAGADQSLSPNSTHRVIWGELDLRGFQQVLSQLDVAGGIVRVESDNPLNVTGDINFDDGRIVAYLDNGTKEDGANAPINASTFKYQPMSSLLDTNRGIYAVVNPDGRTDEDDLNGTWRIIEGDVPNSAELAKKTHLIFPVQPGQDVDLDADELINVGGQLYYVARFDGLDSPLDAAALKDIVLEEGSLNIVVSDKSSDEIIDDSKLPVDELDGCDLTEQLCESLDDDLAQDILDGIIGDDDQEGLEDELPVLHWGQLATLLGSGLAPRNVDAAGRGVALHNNLLVDAVFDRQPLRQFEALLANGDAEAADAGDLSYVDLQDDELDLAKRDGVSAWVKGFGGNSRADDSSVLYNDYSLSAYGTSFGVDVALSETFQIGAYGNYGDLNVNQRSGETGGGSWNPEGWGGGLTAQYSTRNFYLQGLLGASEVSGEQSRNILDVADGLGGNTATGDKTVTSYLAALRVGAPFKSGGVLLEPQGQVVWSQNDEQGFSENHGTEKNLRLKYKNRTTNFVETQLGLKLSVPIRTGERALLVPSLRAAWLADWDMGNEAQEIGYKFTKKTVDFDSDLESQNGALIEAGLDYTIQNHNSTAWKIYGRGGVELWDSDRGATWRASGGVTFQF